MKITRASLCVIPLSLTLLSCAGPGPGRQLSDADVAALQAATEAYRDAEAVNDWEAVTMLYTDSAIRLLPKGPTLVGRKAILEEFRSRPSRIIEYDQRMEEAQGIGDMAFVRGVFTYVVDVAGDTLRGSGKYLAIYRRQSDGSWLIGRDIFNYDSPGTAATTLPRESELADTPDATETLASERTDSAAVCPPADGGGTISPAVSIYSIAFVVNGVEQVVQDGDTLEAMFNDKIEIKEVVICVESFSGSGGEACVDLVPVDQSGQNIMSEHAGTHMVPVIAGFSVVPGPSHTWTLDESWVLISAVLNHWTGEETEDVDCANRRCERDDWAMIELRRSDGE